jgi:hypothetical protein
VGIVGYIHQRPARVVKKKGKQEQIEWETRMLVGPHDDYETKDRTGRLGRVVRRPNMQIMIEAARGSEGDE